MEMEKNRKSEKKKYGGHEKSQSVKSIKVEDFPKSLLIVKLIAKTDRRNHRSILFRPLILFST